MHSESEKVEFSPPPGLSLPDGVKPGEDFDFVSTFRLKPDGRICLVMIGDAKMPGYSDKPEHSESKPDYKEMAQGYSSAIQGQAQGEM